MFMDIKAIEVCTASSSVWLTAMNYVQFSLFKSTSQNIKIINMRGPLGAVIVFFSTNIHLQ